MNSTGSSAIRESERHAPLARSRRRCTSQSDSQLEQPRRRGGSSPFGLPLMSQRPRVPKEPEQRGCRPSETNALYSPVVAQCSAAFHYVRLEAAHPPGTSASTSSTGFWRHRRSRPGTRPKPRRAALHVPAHRTEPLGSARTTVVAASRAANATCDIGGRVIPTWPVVRHDPRARTRRSLRRAPNREARARRGARTRAVPQHDRGQVGSHGGPLCRNREAASAQCEPRGQRQCEREENVSELSHPRHVVARQRERVDERVRERCSLPSSLRPRAARADSAREAPRQTPTRRT